MEKVSRFSMVKASVSSPGKVLVRSLVPAVFCLVCLFLPLAASAQPLGGGGVGGFMFGVHWLDVSELNDELQSGGLATFDSAVFTYGGSGHGFIGDRIIIGGEGHGFSQESSNSTYVQRLSGGYGFFNAGYVLFDRWNLRLYPMAGIGGGAVTLRISEIASLTFDDIIANPAREVQVSTGGFLAQIGGGLDYFLVLNETDEERSGLVLGARVGYTFPFSKADWSMGTQNIIGGPDLGIEGLYVRFMVGGGAVEKE